MCECTLFTHKPRFQQVRSSQGMIMSLWYNPIFWVWKGTTLDEKLAIPWSNSEAFQVPQMCGRIRYSLLTSCSLHLCFWSIFCTRRRTVLKYWWCSVWNSDFGGVKNLGFLLYFGNILKPAIVEIWRLQNFYSL
jgi:hypothetical protein